MQWYFIIDKKHINQIHFMLKYYFVLEDRNPIAEFKEEYHKPQS